VDSGPDCAVNVGSGAGTSVLEVARLLTEALGRTPKLRITGEYRIGDIRHNRADVSRLHEKLTLRPEVSLEAGLARLASWILTQPLPEDRLDQANAEMRQRGMMG
jgi:dTDP-L-rhamnose 4-epimerase